jgi:hypothetical protein
MESPAPHSSTASQPPRYLNLKERCFLHIAFGMQYWQYLLIRATGIATFAAASRRHTHAYQAAVIIIINRLLLRLLFQITAEILLFVPYLLPDSNC